VRTFRNRLTQTFGTCTVGDMTKTYRCWLDCKPATPTQIARLRQLTGGSDTLDGIRIPALTQGQAAAILAERSAK